MPEEVFWTHEEKRRLCGVALDIHEERPDLAGLSLLRAAVKTLPLDRQRRIVTLSQAEWFEAGMAAEAKLRAADQKQGHPTLPVLTSNAANTTKVVENTAASARTAEQWRLEHLDWMARVEAFHEAQVRYHKAQAEHQKTISEDVVQQNETLDELLETVAQHQQDQVLVCCLLKEVIGELRELRSLAMALPIFDRVNRLSRPVARPKLSDAASLKNGTCLESCLKINA